MNILSVFLNHIFSNSEKAINNRSGNITYNILLSFVFRFGTIICSFIILPLTLSYLNSYEYGVWVTLLSFITWFGAFDMGLGHGLRNKFAEAKAKGNTELCKSYTSAAYFSIGLIILVLIIVFGILSNFISWVKFFNVKDITNREFVFIIQIVFAFFCLQLFGNLIITLLVADQKSSYQSMIGFITQLILLTCIWYLTKFTTSSLYTFALTFSIIPVVILFLANIFFFRTFYKDYLPSLRLWKKKYIKPILGLGIKFFIIEMSAIILLSTDNVIISNLFGPNEVTPYNICFKYFSISLFCFNIIVTPYWSGFTDAYFKKDYIWIQQTVKTLLKIAMIFFVVIIVMVLVSPFIFSFWIGKTINIPINLSVAIGLNFALLTFALPLTTLLNGIGRVKPLLITSIIIAFLNIPLAIFLCLTIKLGILGVIISNIICNLPTLFVCYFEYLKIFPKKEQQKMLNKLM